MATSNLLDSNTLSWEQQKNMLFEEGFFSSDQIYIHSSSVIGSEVTLEQGVKIGPFCTILGKTTIGKGTRIFSNVSIGYPAQDVNTKNSQGKIIIGENCEIREFVTIHASKYENGETIIGNNCYIMNFCHVSHDVKLGNNVVLINSVNLAGHVTVGDNVMLMANTASHQNCRIGRLSCLTPYSATRQDLPPFCMFTGQPANFSGLNVVALKRAKLSSEDINSIKHITKLFFTDKLLLEDLKKEVESNNLKNNLYVQEFLSFIESSSRGISRRSLSYGKNLYY